MPTMDFDDFEDFENDDERINKEIDDYLKKLEKSMKDDDLSIVKKSSEEIMNQSNLLLDKFLNACYGELVSVLKIAGEFDQAEYMESVDYVKKSLQKLYSIFGRYVFLGVPENNFILMKPSIKQKNHYLNFVDVEIRSDSDAQEFFYDYLYDFYLGSEADKNSKELYKKMSKYINLKRVFEHLSEALMPNAPYIFIADISRMYVFDMERTLSKGIPKDIKIFIIDPDVDHEILFPPGLDKNDVLNDQYRDVTGIFLDSEDYRVIGNRALSKANIEPQLVKEFRKYFDIMANLDKEMYPSEFLGNLFYAVFTLYLKVLDSIITFMKMEEKPETEIQKQAAILFNYVYNFSFVLADEFVKLYMQKIKPLAVNPIFVYNKTGHRRRLVGAIMNH